MIQAWKTAFHTHILAWVGVALPLQGLQGRQEGKKGHCSGHCWQPLGQDRTFLFSCPTLLWENRSEELHAAFREPREVSGTAHPDRHHPDSRHTQAEACSWLVPRPHPAAPERTLPQPGSLIGAFAPLPPQPLWDQGRDTHDWTTEDCISPCYLPIHTYPLPLSEHMPPDSPYADPSVLQGQE